jgi:hypothetical protein
MLHSAFLVPGEIQLSRIFWPGVRTVTYLINLRHELGFGMIDTRHGLLQTILQIAQRFKAP